MAKFTGKDMADFRQAYFSMLQFFAPLHELYNSYERKALSGKDRDNVEFARLQSSRLETFLDDHPLTLLGRVKFQMQSYLEDDEAGYLPGMMSDDAVAVYGMMQDDSAAAMMKGCLLSNLILNAATLAGLPRTKAGVRPSLAENLRLACYFGEVSNGVDPADAIKRNYPEDCARLAELPFSNSIDTSLAEVLKRVTQQASRAPEPEAPEGYEWKRSETKPHLRLLLKIGS